MVHLEHKFHPVNGKTYKFKGWEKQDEPQPAAEFLAGWLSHDGHGPRRVDFFLGESHYLLEDHNRDTRNLQQPRPLKGFAAIRIEERGRNTGNFFHWWWGGTLAEMVPCLHVMFYILEGKCAQPKADYKIEPAVRERIKLEAEHFAPCRDAIKEVLGSFAVTTKDFSEVLSFYERAVLGSYIATMVMAGITDPAIMKQGFCLELNKLNVICQCVRDLQMTFEEARSELYPDS